MALFHLYIVLNVCMCVCVSECARARACALASSAQFYECVDASALHNALHFKCLTSFHCMKRVIFFLSLCACASPRLFALLEKKP